MAPSEFTPVLVGVGQFVERIDAPDYRGLSFADLAACAASAALMDATAAVDLAPRIDAVGSIRTFEESGAMQVPFGRANKLPLAVARRLNIEPKLAILETVGGQTPLALLADFGDRIARGEIEAALAFGGEAISTVRHLIAQGETRDWTEFDDGEMIDKGLGFEGTLSRVSLAHGIRAPVVAYALCENARRRRLELSREAYAMEMGRLFAPFSEVAAANPYSAAEVKPAAPVELITPSARNRMIAEPYPLKLVSRDQVNQAAAFLLMSVRAARNAGIPEERWAYVHGAALTTEREILDRPDIGAYPAANAAIDAAIGQAGCKVADTSAFDFYSCFPVPVFCAAIDGLGLRADDPRGLTVTGGLPYFGGAGNNYSMHALATMVGRLRVQPGARGLVGANGGFQSKYGATILSTTPCDWPHSETAHLQAQLDSIGSATQARDQVGRGTVETYTVVFASGSPEKAIVIGQHESGGRFIAASRDLEAMSAMLDRDPLGSTVQISVGEKRNSFTFA